MRWDDVLKAVGDEAEAQHALAALFPPAADTPGGTPTPSIRLHGTSKHRVPLLELRLISDVETELWEPIVVQWDIWTASLEAQREAERILRRLFHAEDQVTIAGVDMVSSEYLDGDSLADPDRDGVFGRAIRFRHTPLREYYARSH